MSESSQMVFLWAQIFQISNARVTHMIYWNLSEPRSPKCIDIFTLVKCGAKYLQVYPYAQTNIVKNL